MAKRRLPPLYTLRGFDAAARHLSFSLAAQELHVTQGAIRRQIRELEDFLGTSLFLRATRRVDLTEAGKDYFFAVAHILAELERATERLSRKRKSKTLTLDILPTIATMWLMPLLEQFSETNPEVVCGYSPRSSRPISAREAPTSRSASDACRDAAIRSEARESNWRWSRRRRRAMSSNSAISSCRWRRRKEHRIAIIPKIILAHYEHRDTLRALKSPPIPSAGEYYLLMHESSADDSDVQAVRQWILAEAEKVRPLADPDVMAKTAQAAR
jgi:DNA-binding transcriptional LysR family regulator